MATPSSKLFFVDPTTRPLGQFTQAGHIVSSAGIGNDEMRVFGQYAFVLVLRGSGEYRDANGFRARVGPGDIITVLPELAHRYGPAEGNTWDELYICFRGPIFDLWRREGLVNERQPVRTSKDGGAIVEELTDFCLEPRPRDMAEHLEQLGRFTCLATGLLDLCPKVSAAPAWLEQARGLLRSNLERPVELARVARDCGMSYENFRKQFRLAEGCSPGQYRLRQRIRAAKALLQRGDLTHAVVARSLGFIDEAHFSRRFKDIAGVSPRHWKQQEPAVNNSPETKLHE